jgi:type II secretory pathway pseudopilin PulG
MTRRGFTVLEALIGVAVMAAGIAVIMAVFPVTLRGADRAELQSLGAALAMMKIEEIRRDDDEGGRLIAAIEALTEPTEPIVFPLDPRLAYRFSGVTVLYVRRDNAGVIIDDPDDPRDDPGVARVIIQTAPIPGAEEEILGEFRFN